MASSTTELYDELVRTLKELSVLKSCASLLGWDEQTYMPPGGTEHRGNQGALLAGMCHEKGTSPRLGELLARLESSDLMADPDAPAAVNVREARRDYDKTTKLPRELVEELSRAATLGQQAWVDAKRSGNFGKFLPFLNKMVKLKRDEAQALGYGSGVPYDALLDQYEPGMTCADVQTLFAPLRDDLVRLIERIRGAKKQPPRDILTRSYPVAQQEQFATDAAKAIGFAFDRGRLDRSPHPFCSSIGPGDTRLTTRYNEHHFPGAFFGVLHEAGHGIYEQGLDPESFGLPMGEAVSLGVHESQSRMWENFVGRSRSFWTHFFPTAQRHFPAALGGVALDDFYFAINDVQPSYIRVEADEATYNLHILLRFELEQELIAGRLDAKDVPEAWSSRFQSYFGLTPPGDAQGCLQDIHWSAGLLGYFPTYTLGNMCAAQLFEAARDQLGDLDAAFARGEFSALKTWLNENIHHRGRQFRTQKLIQLVTGRPLTHKPLIAHLERKLAPLYGL